MAVPWSVWVGLGLLVGDSAARTPLRIRQVTVEPTAAASSGHCTPLALTSLPAAVHMGLKRPRWAAAKKTDPGDFRRETKGADPVAPRD